MTHLFLVVGGDECARRAEVIGVYTTYDKAIAAADAAGRKVKGTAWFGCSITTIEIDAPVRTVFKSLFGSDWNGERQIA